MKKVHLRINYGGEERFDFVRKTIEVSQEYFTTVRVVNFGEDEHANKFDELIAKYPHVSVTNLGNNFQMCVTEDLLRSHVMDIEDGEWVSWLDSDWRMPQYFLDNIQSAIQKCEDGEFTHMFSYQLPHTTEDIDWNTTWGTRAFNFDEEMLEGFTEMCSKSDPENEIYGWPMLQKVDKKNLWVDSFMGNHTYFLHVPYKKLPFPKMFHFHFRDYGDHAYCSTMLFQSWWYIGHNVFPTEQHVEISESWEFSAIEAFKLKHKCFTANQLRIMMKDDVFLEKLRTLFLAFEESKIFGCNQMYKLTSKYELKLWTTPPEIECNGICCKYKNGRIFDI